MWCRQCKQDVAARRSPSGPPTCSRCRGLLTQPELCESVARVTDCGVPLDAFDKSRETSPNLGTPQPIEPVDGATLRRIQRKLQPSLRFDGPPMGRARGGESPMARIALVPSANEVSALASPRERTLVRTQPAWGVSLLLAVGGAAAATGFTLLVVANMMLHAAAWRWGFAITTGGETLIIAGLAGMAVRLWRNSRRLNAQLEGIDRRLEVVQSTLVQPPASHIRLRHDAFAAPGSGRG